MPTVIKTSEKTNQVARMERNEESEKENTEPEANRNCPGSPTTLTDSKPESKQLIALC